MTYPTLTEPGPTLTPLQHQRLLRNRKRACRRVHRAFAEALRHAAERKAAAYRALFRHQTHVLELAITDQGAQFDQPGAWLEPDLLQSDRNLAELLHAYECAVRDQVRGAFREALRFADRSKQCHRSVMKGGRDLIQDARQTLYAPMLAGLLSMIGTEENDDAAD